MSNKRAATFHGLTPAEIEADVQAKGNDRSAWPYVVGVEERIAAGAAARVALDRGNPEVAEREALVEAIECAIPDDLPGYRDRYTQRAADNILAAGFRRSQPAPRTVSAAEVEAACWPHQDPDGPDIRVPVVATLAALGIPVTTERDR